MRNLGLSLTLAVSISVGTSAFSQSAAPTADPAWKAPELVEDIGLKKGDKVADVVALRLTAALAQAVERNGDSGHPLACRVLRDLWRLEPCLPVGNALGLQLGGDGPRVLRGQARK